MRTPSQDLVELILSLSRNEKGYFRKTVGQSPQTKQFMRVFDMIEKRGKCDDAAIRKETGIRNLSRIKNYLYENITRVLCQFHGQASVQAQVNEWLQAARILYNRLLFSQAEKMLAKAEKLALNHEFFHNLLEISEFRRKIFIRNHPSSEELVRILERENKESRNIVALLQNLIDYRTLLDESFSFVHHQGNWSRSKEQREHLDHLLLHPLLKDKKRAQSYMAKCYRWQTLHFIHKNKRELEACYRIAVSMIKDLQSKPEIIRQQAPRYVVLHHFLLTSCADTGRYNELANQLANIKAFLADPAVVSTPELELAAFSSFKNMELAWYLDLGQAQKAKDLAPRIEEELIRYEKDIPKVRKLFFYFNLAEAYFINEDYRKAVYWIHKLLNEKDMQMRMQVQTLARIFHLILHFELQNRDLLPYITRSTYRYLLKQKRLFKVEKVLLQFIRGSSGINTRKEWLNAFRSLREELLPLRNDPYEKEAFAEIDYICWLDSKLRKRPYAELIREKVASEERGHKG